MKGLLICHSFGLFTVMASFGQVTQPFDAHLLDQYPSYLESNWPFWKTKIKYQKLNDSIVSKKVIHNGEVGSETIFHLDSFGNVVMEVAFYGTKTDTVQSILVYSKGQLIEKLTDNGLIEKYSGFTACGKPRQIHRNDSIFFPFKEVFEYNELCQLTKSSTWQWVNNNFLESTEAYAYNDFGDVLEVKRSFDPSLKFPISVTGGLILYENERFEYRRGKYSFWTRKYRFANGKRKLITKRKVL